MSATVSESDLKNVVRTKYAEIAEGAASCCCSSKSADFVSFSDDYSSVAGYAAEADLSLGCGIPTEHAGIERGDTVLDLGSGAGNDVFVASTLVGEEGRVIGLDFTEAMVEKAKANAGKLGVTNVEFRLGDIEAMPFEDGEVDVIVSNCVLNLVPDKRRAFDEMLRVMTAGGRFCVSDIVTRGPLTPSVRGAVALHAGCVSGALDQEDYVTLLRETGFEDVRIVKEKTVPVPDEALKEALSQDEIDEFRSTGTELRSVTVVGRKATNSVLDAAS